MSEYCSEPDVLEVYKGASSRIGHCTVTRADNIKVDGKLTGLCSENNDDDDADNTSAIIGLVIILVILGAFAANVILCCKFRNQQQEAQAAPLTQKQQDKRVFYPTFAQLRADPIEKTESTLEDGSGILRAVPVQSGDESKNAAEMSYIPSQAYAAA